MLGRFILFSSLALGALGCDVVESSSGVATTSSGSSGGGGNGGSGQGTGTSMGDGGCPASDSSGSGAGDPFIAFASDFAAFDKWEKFALGNGAPSDPVHNQGPLNAYLNKRPPCGAKEFPVGTIIVKELEKGALTQHVIFAAVKRGGGYNPMGAKDWEWFELQRNDGADTVHILWGSSQPSVMYAGTGGDCNSCHLGAKANDYIWSAPLDLKTLESSESKK